MTASIGGALSGAPRRLSDRLGTLTTVATTLSERPKRRLRVVLGLAWLIDAALQAQPFMFSRGFPRQVIDANAVGQPAVVAVPLHWFATLLGSEPWINGVFVAAQLAIGVALLVGRWARPALMASILWALGIWYFGDGLGGVLSGHASMLTGFPASALLYAAVSIGLWPATGIAAPIDGAAGPPTGWGTPGPVHRARERWRQLDVAWGRNTGGLAVASWVVLWVAAGVFGLLPSQLAARSVGGALSSMASSAPPALSTVDHLSAYLGGSWGTAVAALLAATEVLIGVGVLRDRWRRSAVGSGLVLSVVFWVFGQTFGGVYLGTATDPNSGPLYVLLGIVIATTVPALAGAVRQGAVRPPAALRELGAAAPRRDPADRGPAFDPPLRRSAAS